MDFTELYKHSNALVAFSQGAHFILTAVHDRLIARRADTFQVSRSWQIDTTPSASNVAITVNSRRPADSGPITHIGWSGDSEYVLASCAKHGVTHVFCMRDEQWHAAIEAGTEGLVKAEWAQDGRHVLCFSEWGLRVTVWSLLTGTPVYIQYPIHPDRGYAFRRDGRYFILAERHKSKDTVGVYDTANNYKLVRHYPLPTSSIASMSISPTGNHLAVWEGPLEYKLCILSLTGELLGTFKPDPDPGLGIRCVAWHPSGMFIAVAGWDDKIYILEHLTWSRVATLNVSTRVSDDISIWREPSHWLEATEGRGFLSYERLSGPHTVPSAKPDHSKAYPKSGAVQLEFNKIGMILMARFEHMSTAVHLFSFPAPGEAFAPKLRSVLIHSRPVLHARWNPLRAGSLVATCGGSAMYTWSDEWVGEGGEAEEMAECIGIPAKNFEARDVRWAPDGKGMALLDKETFCCAFEVEQGEEEI